MKNDSKLGLLAGVAGVVVAAVLYSQPQPVVAPKENAKSAPPPAATPVAPPATSVVARTRPEIEAKTTSRPARSDDDD